MGEWIDYEPRAEDRTCAGNSLLPTETPCEEILVRGVDGVRTLSEVHGAASGDEYVSERLTVANSGPEKNPKRLTATASATIFGILQSTPINSAQLPSPSTNVYHRKQQDSERTAKNTAASPARGRRTAGPSCARRSGASAPPAAAFLESPHPNSLLRHSPCGRGCRPLCR